VGDHQVGLGWPRIVCIAHHHDHDGRRAGRRDPLRRTRHDDGFPTVGSGEVLVAVRRTDERVVFEGRQLEVLDAATLGGGGHHEVVPGATSRAVRGVGSAIDTDVHPDDDVDVAGLWASSGAQWLTAAGVDVPARLVRRVTRLTANLDAAGGSLAAAVGSLGLGVLGERAAAVGLPPSRSTSAGGSCHLIQTAAGPCAVSLPRPSDVDLVPAWLESFADTDLENDDAIWSIVGDVLASADERRVIDLVERARWLGLPVALAGEIAPSADPVHAERLGEANPLPLVGANVVNLGSLWAAPLAGATLAALGARVIKVESTTRPDGARRHRSFFASLHSGCESVAFDLARSSGQARLAQLLDRADVVIEGSRPRALAQMGIDARQVVRSGPQVWASITGHGRRPAFEHRVGFGDDAAVAGGLVGQLIGELGGGVGTNAEAVFIADAVGDPITGLTTAHAIADRLASGGRWLLDIALANVAASMAGEWVPALPMETASRPQRRIPAGAMHPLTLGCDTQAVVKEFDLAE
jgi:hypothetical protein